MEQPFRAYAKTLLEKQSYPVRRLHPKAPPERPYDVAGWTLPWQMNVKLDRYEQWFEPPPSTKLDAASIAPAQVWGDRRAAFFVVDGRGNGATIAINRALKAGFEALWTTRPLELQGFTYAPGAIVVRGTGDPRALMEGVARDLGLRVTAGRAQVLDGLVPLHRARVGLYKPWVENIDEGWTRWLLEQYEFAYETVTDQDVRRGGLNARFDAIVLPDMAADRMTAGHAEGTMPPEYVGGLGPGGVAAIKQFVESGGTLVTLDSSSELALKAFSLPVKNVLQGVSPDQFFCPGSLLRLNLDPSQPLAFGMPPSTAAFFAFGSAFAAAEPTPGPSSGAENGGANGAVRIIGRYADKDVLMSGWLEGEALISGQGAAVEATVGQGRVVLLGFRAQHRAQSHATFRLLFNALHTAGR
jgi:hypothetical protein